MPDEKEQEEQVKIFVSGSCGPCQEVKDLVQQGRFNRENIDLVDIETEEGYPQVEKMHLSRVPSAFRGTEECKLRIDDENKALIIECPGDDTEQVEETPQ